MGEGMHLKGSLVGKPFPVCGLLLTLTLFACGGGAAVDVNSGSQTSPPGSAPGAPTGLQATASNAAVALSWSASSHPSHESPRAVLGTADPVYSAPFLALA